MAMIEALSCGLPIIVPADADIEEVAIHGQNGIVVESGNMNTFTDAVITLLENETLYKQAQQGALMIRQQKRQEYSLTHQIDIWANSVPILRNQSIFQEKSK